jgi:phasin family protein
MPDNTTQFANQAQDATRSLFKAAQDGAAMQLKVIQRLSEIQQRGVRQAIAAGNEQVQILRNVRDPRALADAQAELVKRHGQRYVEYAQEAFEVVAEAWQDYGERLQGTIHTMRDKAQRATSSRKAA